MKYPVCKLASILSPGKYCVVSTDSEHVAEVKILEKALKEEMCNDGTSEFPLNCQMCVAVRNLEGQFRRGVIEKKLKEDLYLVLLIDYGHVLEVEKSNIKVITNKDFTKVEPLAFMVKLYGLIPAKHVFIGGVKKPKAFRDWTPESQVFVQNIFESNHKIVVHSILIQKRTVYGDLFLKPMAKMKFTSLRKLLCKNEFCIYSESNFLKREGFDSSDERVQLETKMEFVRKWQRENFGEVKKFLYELPALVSSSTACEMNLVTSNISSLNSVPHFSKQAKLIPDRNDSISKISSEKPRRFGVGRGKVKLMIAEIKNRKIAPLGGDDGSCFQSESFNKIEASTKISLGRGQLLKKYFEMNKSFYADVEVSPNESSSSRTDLKDNNFYAPQEQKKPLNQRMNDLEILHNTEKVVIKVDQYSEFNDSNELREISLSTENEPLPLARNVEKEKKFENLESKKNQIDHQNNFKNLNLKEKKQNLSNPNNSKSSRDERFDYKLSEDDISSHNSERQIPFENFKIREGGSLRCEESISIWELPLSLTKLNNSWTPYVLFDDCVVKPVNTFRELPIQPNIIKNLEKGGKFCDLSQMQRWAIPAIRKQHNTVLIGSSKTGKTLSYIIPLIDYIQDEFYFEELPQGNGPSVIIIASSAFICESIYFMCHSLLGNFTKRDVLKSNIKIVLAHGSGCEKEVWVNLTNGCDMLISTPHCLVRLLKMPVLTNFERLTCLVLDEIDIISQKPFRKSVRTILERAQLSTKNRHYQKILCGEKWTSNVENIVNTYVKSYALVICSYSEAVIYKGLKPSIYLVNQNKKSELLVDKLKDEIGNSKILIVCEEKSEACRLHEFLIERKIHSLLAHENILADKLKEYRTIWKSSADSVLIITDGVLNELNIREAQTLVHYGLPNKSKTNFFLRYSTLESFLRDKQSFLKTEDKRLSMKLHDIILVDDENHYQLPHIVDFVVRLGGKISPRMLRKIEDIRKLIEIEKQNSVLCKNLLALGRCRNSKDCPQRHILVKELDSPKDLPNSGWINFVVLKIHDASWFSARLLEHVDGQGTTSKLIDHYMKFSEELLEFYKSETNQKPLGTPKIGEICAVKTEFLNQNIFYRGKIIEYLKVDKYEKALEVNVKLIDLGDEWTRKCTELYELPENLSRYPATAVDVRIVGVQPLDFDVSWSQKARDFVEDLLTRKLEENQYWSGKIVLALNNTLFLNPVKRKHYLPHLNTHVFDLVVQNELLNNRLAVVNNDHLPLLLKLCAEGDIKVAKKEDTKKEDLVITQPQWAFFDSDFIQVRFLAAESPSTVFLQSKKFEKQLQELEEDCQKEGTKATKKLKAEEAKKSDWIAGTLSVGMFCLALFEDGKWNRGRVESETENEFCVFFVDHGDFLLVAKSSVIPIPQALLLRLPCQAVECRLIGIQQEEKCPLEVLQEIYSFSEDGKEDLYAYINGDVLEPNITSGRKYSLNLLNKKGTSLNKILVDRGMVHAEESEKENLENIELGISFIEEELNKEEEKQIVLCDDLKPSYTISWENDFKNFSDDVFEDENALEFLKEFASKIFPFSAPFQENHSFSKDSTSVENNSSSSRVIPESSSEQSIARPNIRQLLKFHKNQRSKRKKLLELKNREEVLTPQVLWCQNQLEIQLKILLGNVKDYNLECTVKNISFRCIIDEKFYAADLKLFGAISPQMTKVTLKAFHVLIVLTKLAFPLWPRLLADEGKHRWINLDVESLIYKDRAFSEKIRTAKLEIASGNVKEGIRDDNIRPYSGSEDSNDPESDFDSENSQY